MQARFGARLAAIDAGIAKDGAFYLFTLRLVPLVPFFVINLLMGLTRMKARDLLLGQPDRHAGRHAGLRERRHRSSRSIDSLRGILSPALIGSFVLLGVFPLVAKKVLDAVQARARSTRAGAARSRSASTATWS